MKHVGLKSVCRVCRVPASQHPEIAPKEFEKFLQQNALAKRERNSLRRRSSILSVSFTASDAEQEEKEEEKDQDKDGRQASLDALERKLVSDTTEAHDDDNNNNNNSTGPDEGDQGSERKSRLRRSISLGMMNAEGKFCACVEEKRRKTVLTQSNRRRKSSTRLFSFRSQFVSFG